MNDLSTALLMTKAYEGMVREGKTKAEALRDAQRWLRDLTTGQALALVEAKQAEVKERMAWEDIAPWRRGFPFADPATCPFAHPYRWAAFQCVGV